MIWMNFQGPTFEMQVPSDWFIAATPEFQAVFFGTPAPNGTRPNLSVAMSPITPEVTASSVALEARKTQAANYPNFHIIDEQDYTQTGGSAYIRRYIWTDQQLNLSIFQIQGFYVYSHMLYTLTATCGEDEADILNDIFDTMLNSFRLKAETSTQASH